MEKITYTPRDGIGGTFEVDVDKLPEVSLVRLVAAGLAHTLGNVVSAQVNANIKSDIGGDAEPSKAAIAEYRRANVATINGWTAELRVEQFNHLLEGTIKESNRGGPRKDPIEVQFDKLVEQFAMATVKKAGCLMGKRGRPIWPAKDTGEVVLRDKQGNSFTRNAFLAAIKASPKGKKLHVEAVKMVKAAANATETGSELDSMDSLLAA